MTLRELETAIASLPPAEFHSFAKWFEKSLADAWDRRIEKDLSAGRLDEAGRQAERDFEACQ